MGHVIENTSTKVEIFYVVIGVKEENGQDRGYPTSGIGTTVLKGFVI